jgi:thioredoxin-related protein
MQKFFVVSALLLSATCTLVGQTSPRNGATLTNSKTTKVAPAQQTAPSTTPRGGSESARGSRPANSATNNRPSANETPAPRNTTPRSVETVRDFLPETPAAPQRSQSTRPAYANPNETRIPFAPRSKKPSAAKTQAAERVAINWMSIEQALEKSKTEKRKIFVDVYTNWCGWCKHMDSTTFVNAAVAQYLNEHYYPVKFNAEQQQDIVFKDKTYQFKKVGNRGHHELAAEWLNNRLSFPTIVFLDEALNLIQPVPGYQDAAKMEAIINYFGTDNHKKTPWESYEKNFSPKQ